MSQSGSASPSASLPSSPPPSSRGRPPHLPQPPPATEDIVIEGPPPPNVEPFLKNVLRSSAFLEGLKEEELHVSGKDLTDLVRKARAVKFATGETLLQQGSKHTPMASQPLYIIQQGAAGAYVTKKHATGSSATASSATGAGAGAAAGASSTGGAPAGPQLVRVATVHPGDIAGDMSLYTDMPPSVSVKSESEVIAWRIDKSSFDEWISSRPAVKRSLEQRKWLWGVLSKNYLFRGLDDDLQKESLLSHFEQSKAAFNQPIVEYGEQGDRFYVLKDGMCSVEVPRTSLMEKPYEGEKTVAAQAASTSPFSRVKDKVLSFISPTKEKPKEHPVVPSAPPPSSAATTSPPAAPAPISRPLHTVSSSSHEEETDEEDVAAAAKTGLAGKMITRLEPTPEEVAEATKFLTSGKAWSGTNPLLPHHDHMVQIATKSPGESFGEIALLYQIPRCATVRCIASEGCDLFSVDANSFSGAASRGSLYLKAIFYEHASVVLAETNERFMNQSDFFKAIKHTKWHERDSQGKKVDAAAAAASTTTNGIQLTDSSLNLMFYLADQSGNKLISLTEFVLLYGLLQAPYTKYQLAFRLFDQDKSGMISKQEFIQAIRALAYDKAGKITGELQNDPFIKDIFDSKQPGQPERQLTFAEFESLLQRDVLPSFLQNVSNDLKTVNEYWTNVDMALSSGFSYSEGMLSGSALSSQAGVGSSLTWKSLVAGGVAGACSRTLVAPFERLKLLFQMQGQPPRYTGVIQGLRLIHAEDGIKGYFRGNLSNVIRITPASAFQFFFYDVFKSVMFGNRKDLHPVERLAAGGCAGMMACFLTYPLDFIRARLTMQGGSNTAYTGIWHGLTSVVRQGGVRSLYKGLWPSLVGIFPYIGIDFSVYETLRTHLPPSMKNSRGDTNRIALFCCGATAGIVGQTVAYPLDLVRRRMQVQGFQHSQFNYQGGILQAMRTIVREEGVRGLYRGMIPNYVKVVPAVSVSFVVYEQMRRVLDL